MLPDCVIPAAGSSSRMGAWKPLLPFGPSTIVETTVGAALSGGCGRVLLVVGYRGEELAELFRPEPRVVAVRNNEWAKGMLGSIQAALPLVEGGAFFCLNADMPFVDPASFALLAGVSRETEEKGEGEMAVFAAHGGEQGHPVLIPSAWRPRILELDPTGRMQAFLSTRPRKLVECGPGAIIDLDTPEAYAAVAARRSSGPSSKPSPSPEQGA